MTTTVAIELCDAALRAATDAGPVAEPSPGYALLNGKDLWVGRQALASSRLKPRWVDNRFWDRLSTEPMPRPFPRSLSRADVAHAHLAEFWSEIQRETGADSETASVLLAVPGSFSVDQLGLILGVARACGMPVSGVVDTAVAAVAHESIASRLLHVDVGLHRWIWTELRHDGELARQRVEVLEGGGLAKIWDAWAKRIADLLIRQTRFDPFHHGQAEQSLYDQLPSWLDALTLEGSVQVTLESEDKSRSVALDSASISTVTGDLIFPVIELARLLVGAGDQPAMLLSSRAAGVPGLAAELSQLVGREVIQLDSGAPTKGALAFRKEIESPGSELPYVVRLPADLQSRATSRPARSSPAPPVLDASGPAPTHVLFEGRALSIGAEPLWLGSAIAEGERGISVGGPVPGLSRMHCSLRKEDGRVWIEDHSSFGTFLNGSLIEDKAAGAVGDRLRLGSPGVELQLISVVEDDV